MKRFNSAGWLALLLGSILILGLTGCDEQHPFELQAISPPISSAAEATAIELRPADPTLLYTLACQGDTLDFQINWQKLNEDDPSEQVELVFDTSWLSDETPYLFRLKHSGQHSYRVGNVPANGYVSIRFLTYYDTGTLDLLTYIDSKTDPLSDDCRPPIPQNGGNPANTGMQWDIYQVELSWNEPVDLDVGVLNQNNERLDWRSPTLGHSQFFGDRNSPCVNALDHATESLLVYLPGEGAPQMHTALDRIRFAVSYYSRCEHQTVENVSYTLNIENKTVNTAYTISDSITMDQDHEFTLRELANYIVKDHGVSIPTDDEHGDDHGSEYDDDMPGHYGPGESHNKPSDSPPDTASGTDGK